MILEYIVSDIPGYWGTFTEVNNLLRASTRCLEIARTVCYDMRDNTAPHGSLVERSMRWDWKVATAFIMVMRRSKRNADGRTCTDAPQKKAIKRLACRYV